MQRSVASVSERKETRHQAALDRRRRAVYGAVVRFLFVLLIPLGILVFHNLSGAGFVGDDWPQFVQNESIQRADQLLTFFTGSTFYSGGSTEMSGIYYRPVMMTTFAVLYRLWGTSAFHLHLVLVAFGILNSILAFRLFRNFFTPFVSFLGAAAFLLQPMNAEVLEYVSNYQDGLFMFFGMAALNLEAIRKTNSVTWLAAEFVLLLLAFLSKETGLLYFPVLLLLHLLLRERRRALASQPLYLTVGAAAFGYLCLRVLVSGVHVAQSHHTPMELAPLMTRLLNMPAVAFYYIKTFFFPWPLSIAQHWLYREVSAEGFLIPLLAIGMFLAFAAFSVRRFGWTAGFFLTWWTLGVAMHLHLIPLDSTVADRWHYFPSMGLIGLLLLWIQAGMSKHSLRYYSAGLALLFIFGFGVRTHLRNEDWLNEETLLVRDLSYQPESFAMMSQLGLRYIEQGRYAEACPLLEKSVAIAPSWAVNTNNLGVCYYKIGQWRDAEKFFRKSMENGRYYLAYENLAGLLLTQQRFDEAAAFLEDALKIFPANRVMPGMLEAARQASRQNGKGG